MIDVGQTAPPITLPDQNGTIVKLEDLRGGPVVVYFYPKDDTPGCTKQACGFRDMRPDFQRVGVTVLGISPDDETSHTKFVQKFDLNFTLLADVPGENGPETCNAYGVWQEKSMYGRKSMGVVRTTYLIDAEGKVAYRWDNVKVPGHVEAVLEAVGS